MKELRSAKGGALRVLFGGDRTGEWNDWYEWAVSLADELYDEYSEELRNEALI